MTEINVKTRDKKGKISKYIYGQFAEHLGRCIYEGLYVGEDSEIENVNGMRRDVVDALKELEIPVLRWPGGCFADDYHWRDGIGPKEDRPYMVNTNWGKVVENNHFGTHEFFELVEQLGTEAYICGNVGSGTVREMRDWVEYMTFGGDSPLANERRKNGREEPWKLKFFGVGNENWGCGGAMSAKYYADEFRRYATFIRDYGDEPLYKIAGGPDSRDTHWMKVMMKKCAHQAQGISVHNYTYTHDYMNKGVSTDDDLGEYYSLLENAFSMEETIAMHEKIMDKYDPEKKKGLIVDEWGTWYDVLPGTNPGFLLQQNTIRDAVCAMVILHIFQKHNDRIFMANIAQMVNVLQSMVLTEGDKMVKTPTYYVFKMMKAHMDAERVDVKYDGGVCGGNGHALQKISADASVKDGRCLVTLCNTSAGDEEEITVTVDGDYKNISGTVMSADKINDFNDFDGAEKVAPKELEIKSENGKIMFTIPRLSVAAITLE